MCTDSEVWYFAQKGKNSCPEMQTMKFNKNDGLWLSKYDDIIDGCIDIYVMMSSNLSETSSSARANGHCFCLV